jgi:hypothetical protein
VLPKLFESERRYDLCLIDGSHAWPTVFVDFCFANACLRQGGLLMLDDVQLHFAGPFRLLASVVAEIDDEPWRSGPASARRSCMLIEPDDHRHGGLKQQGASGKKSRFASPHLG